MFLRRSKSYTNNWIYFTSLSNGLEHIFLWKKNKNQKFWLKHRHIWAASIVSENRFSWKNKSGRKFCLSQLEVFFLGKRKHNLVYHEITFLFFLGKRIVKHTFYKGFENISFGKDRNDKEVLHFFLCIFECLIYFLVYIFFLGKRIVNRVPQTVKTYTNIYWIRQNSR